MKLSGLSHKMRFRIKFKIDSKIEAKNIPLIVGLGGYKMLTKEAYNLFDNKTKRQLYPEVLKLHRKYKRELLTKKELIEKDWRKIEERYFLELHKIGLSVNLNKSVYLSPSIQEDITDVISRKNCFINFREEKSIINYIVMHEITHLYYSDYISNNNISEAGKSPLMEGVDHLILFKSPIKNLVNSTTKYEKLGFVKSNPKFMKELEKIWEKRKNFESFLGEAIKVQRRYKNIKIC